MIAPDPATAAPDRWGDVANALTTVIAVLVAAALARRNDAAERRRDALGVAHAAATRLRWLVLSRRPEEEVDHALDTLVTAAHDPALDAQDCATAVSDVTTALAVASTDEGPLARQRANDALNDLVTRLATAAASRTSRMDRVRPFAAMLAFAVALVAPAPPTIVVVLLIALYALVWRVRW